MNFVKTLAAVSVAALLTASTQNVAEASSLNFGFNHLNTVSTLQVAANNRHGRTVNRGHSNSRKTIKGGSTKHKSGRSNTRSARKSGQGRGKAGNQKNRKAVTNAVRQVRKNQKSRAAKRQKRKAGKYGR